MKGLTMENVHLKVGFGSARWVCQGKFCQASEAYLCLREIERRSEKFYQTLLSATVQPGRSIARLCTTSIRQLNQYKHLTMIKRKAKFQTSGQLLSFLKILGILTAAAWILKGSMGCSVGRFPCRGLSSRLWINSCGDSSSSFKCFQCHVWWSQY